MNLPTFLRVVFLQLPELDGRFLHNHSPDSGSDCRGLLGSTPATWWYRFLPPENVIHEVTVLNGTTSKGGNRVRGLGEIRQEVRRVPITECFSANWPVY